MADPNRARTLEDLLIQMLQSQDSDTGDTNVTTIYNTTFIAEDAIEISDAFTLTTRAVGPYLFNAADANFNLSYFV